MTIFYLVRHGETDWNAEGRWQGHADVPLNSTGQAQAQLLAAWLAHNGTTFDAIYSSDLLRAWNTAQAISAALHVPVQPLPAIREINLGTWSGLTRAEVRVHDPETLALIDAGGDLPRGGAERFADLEARAAGALHHLAAMHNGQQIALVTHGGTIRAMLHHIAANTGLDFWHTAVGNTSVSVVAGGATGWDITSVNNMDHLAGTAYAEALLAEPPDDAQQV